MKRLPKACLLSAAILFSFLADAQNDTPKLTCPLDEAKVVPPPKNRMKLDETDYCIVLTSVPDTVVKAVGTGRVTNTENTEESGYGIVMFTKINGKEYYLWFTGMNKLLVKRNDVVKPGQPIGYISPGNKIELTMYEFDTPIDPLTFLNCPGVLKSN